MAQEASLKTRHAWPGRLLAAAVLLLGAGFLVAFGARPAILLSWAGLDDALFARLGQSIAAGQWLGAYDHTTLVKGVGFPLFLAANNISGLPYPVGVAAFHLACAGLAAWAVSRALQSRWAGAALFALLLLMPPMYAGDLMRVNRELFYASLTTGLFGAAIALAAGRGLSRSVAALLTGGLLAWAWLAREEGVWLLPGLLVLAAAPLLARTTPPEPRRPLARGLLADYGPAALAALVGVIGVAAVGAVNDKAYGRFVINEIKDPVFQDTLDALQEASAPYRREMVPVPRAARARLYAVSPALATLKEPVLDGPGAEGYTKAGCMADQRLCGELGGGWFLWVFREAVAQAGHHRSLKDSRAFYRQITAEVRQACGDGRLACERWDVPMVPPMEPDQVDDVGASVLKAVDAMTFGAPVGPSGEKTDLSAPTGAAMYEFLNRPAHGGAEVTHTLNGWFKHAGPRWFDLTPGSGVQVERFGRKDSPDLAVWFKDPGVTRHRYDLQFKCAAAAPCPAQIHLEDGQTFDVDLAALDVGPHRFGPAELYVDGHASASRQAYLKDGFSQRWVAFASGLNGPFRGVLVAGALALLVVLVRAIVTRRVSLGLLICTALLGSVAARVVILALIDALSFPAANASYGLAAVPLLLIAAVVALHEALGPGLRAISRRRPAAA